jgi:hypothetical protein
MALADRRERVDVTCALSMACGVNMFRVADGKIVELWRPQRFT